MLGHKNCVLCSFPLLYHTFKGILNTIQVWGRTDFCTNSRIHWKTIVSDSIWNPKDSFKCEWSTSLISLWNKSCDMLGQNQFFWGNRSSAPFAADNHNVYLQWKNSTLYAKSYSRLRDDMEIRILMPFFDIMSQNFCVLRHFTSCKTQHSTEYQVLMSKPRMSWLYQSRHQTQVRLMHCSQKWIDRAKIHHYIVWFIECKI